MAILVALALACAGQSAATDSRPSASARFMVLQLRDAPAGMRVIESSDTTKPLRNRYGWPLDAFSREIVSAHQVTYQRFGASTGLFRITSDARFFQSQEGAAGYFREFGAPVSHPTAKRLNLEPVGDSFRAWRVYGASLSSDSGEYESVAVLEARFRVGRTFGYVQTVWRGRQPRPETLQRLAALQAVQIRRVT